MVLQAAILLCDFLVAAAVTWLLNWPSILQTRHLEELHWTERARKLWPARAAAGSALWLIPFDLVLGQQLLWPSFAPPWGLVALSAFLGAWVGNYSLHGKIFSWLTPRRWIDQLLAAVAFRFSWWFLLALLISIMPREFSGLSIALFAMYPAFLVIWIAGGVVWLFRKLGLLTLPPDRLLALVSSASLKAKIPYRRVWLLTRTGAAAFALPYTKDLLFSERLLKLHPDDEVTAICAHELGHLSEPKLVQAGRLLGAMALSAFIFLKPVFYTWGPAGLFFLLTGTWVLLLAARHLSRAMERRADQIARANEPDPAAYARALARLHEDNLIPAVMPRKTTHPDLYDRLVSIGATPDYPRPEKPCTISWQIFVLAAPLGILIAINVIPLLTSLGTSNPEERSGARSEQFHSIPVNPLALPARFEFRSLSVASSVFQSTQHDSCYFSC